MNRPELRIGDLERDAAVTALGDHYAAGRLTKEEFDDRADVAWRARTRSELAPLFADLPALHSTPPGARASAPSRPPQGGRRRSGPPVVPILLLLLVLAGVSGLEVWPIVLLGLAYVWLRMWMGLATFRQRFAARSERTSWGSAVEPWRRPRQ